MVRNVLQIKGPKDSDDIILNLEQKLLRTKLTAISDNMFYPEGIKYKSFFGITSESLLGCYDFSNDSEFFFSNLKFKQQVNISTGFAFLLKDNSMNDNLLVTYDRYSRKFKTPEVNKFLLKEEKKYFLISGNGLPDDEFGIICKEQGLFNNLKYIQNIRSGHFKKSEKELQLFKDNKVYVPEKMDADNIVNLGATKEFPNEVYSDLIVKIKEPVKIFTDLSGKLAAISEEAYNLISKKIKDKKLISPVNIIYN